MLNTPGFFSARTFLQLSRPTLGRVNRSRIQWRNASTHTGRSDKRRSLFGVVSGGAILAVGLSPFYTPMIHADAVFKSLQTTALDDAQEMSLGALIRSYLVYTMCSIPVLVDNSPKLLQLASIPGIKSITDAFIRVTFFDHVRTHHNLILLKLYSAPIIVCRG